MRVSAASGPHGESAEKYFVTPALRGVGEGLARCIAVASAPAKVIIIGEHFVVWGSKALATAVSLRARARVLYEPANRLAVHVHSRSLNLTAMVWPRCENEQVCQLGRIVEALAERLEPGTYVVEIESSIPVAAGLGSSAAVATAFTASIMEAAGEKVSAENVSRLAYEAEKLVHGRPSGIDNTVSSYGGTLVYRIGSKPELLRTRLRDAKMLVIDSRVRRRTREAVERALSFRLALGKRIESQLLNLVDSIVDAAREAAVKADFERLGALMRFNHGLLNAIGVTGRLLDTIVSAVESIEGVYGVKMTGAGLGGVVIALVPRELGIDKVKERLKPLGADVVEVEAEEPGVALEPC